MTTSTITELRDVEQQPADRRATSATPGRPCTARTCRCRDVDGAEQTQIVAPVHQLDLEDGRMLHVRYAAERGGVFMAEVLDDFDDPELVVAAATPRELVDRLGRFGPAVGLALQLRLEDDRDEAGRR